MLGNIHSVGSSRTAMPLAVSIRATYSAIPIGFSPSMRWVGEVIHVALEPGRGSETCFAST